MTVTLGASPDHLVVQLSHDADFFQTMHTKSGAPWPSGAQVELRFSGGRTWAATIEDDVISWNVDKVEVETLLDSKPKLVRLFYTEGEF